MPEGKSEKVNKENPKKIFLDRIMNENIENIKLSSSPIFDSKKADQGKKEWEKECADEELLNRFWSVHYSHGLSMAEDGKEWKIEDSVNALLPELLEEVVAEERARIREKIEKIDVSGGGSGRRLKIQLLGFLDKK